MGVLVPIFGVSIPLIVVFGKFILEPLLRARASAEPQRIAMLEAQVARLEQNLEGMERAMGRLVEEQQFMRELSSPAAAARPGAAA